MSEDTIGATIIARSFQKGKTVDTVDMASFQKHVDAFRGVLNCSNVDRLIVVTCGEGKFSEIPDTAGLYPTVKLLAETFPEEVKSGRLIVHVCMNWGNNPGSGEALNDGLKIAQQKGSKYVLNWSPEMECTQDLIGEAIAYAEKKSLVVVGGLRQNWWEKPQWKVPQNTLALWRVDVLCRIGGFAPECNGTGETVETAEFGAVPLAGMEDFHALLRIMRDEPNFDWGMIKKDPPLRWDTNFEPGSEREQNHLKKVARQYIVMKRYAEMVFPGVAFGDVMDKLFAKMHLA